MKKIKKACQTGLSVEEKKQFKEYLSQLQQKPELSFNPNQQKKSV